MLDYFNSKNACISCQCWCIVDEDVCNEVDKIIDGEKVVTKAKYCSLDRYYSNKKTLRMFGKETAADKVWLKVLIHTG